MNLHPAVSMINVFALWKESSNYSHPLQLWAAVTVTPYSTAFLLYSSFCRGEVRPYSIISNVSCNDPLFFVAHDTEKSLYSLCQENKIKGLNPPKSALIPG